MSILNLRDHPKFVETIPAWVDDYEDKPMQWWVFAGISMIGVSVLGALYLLWRVIWALLGI